MKKVLIVYAGKTGTTKQCAYCLAEKLPQAEVADLNSEDANPDEFDIIVIGSSIRMGAVQKSVKAWIKEHKESLLTKQVGGFICNGFMEQEDEILERNYTEEFRNHAFYLKSFGGELNLEKIKGFDKFITTLVSRGMNVNNHQVPHIQEERIQEMANAVLGL